MSEHNPAAIVTTAKAEPAPDSAGITSLFAGWTAAEVDLVRRTIAPDATEHELALLLRLCRTYGLDPFRRELVMEKRRRRRRDGGEDLVPIFITTRDGYLKVAQRDAGYGGLQSGVVHEGDEFEYDVQNFTIKHRFGGNRGKILGAWATAFHTTRPPFMAYVEFPEYNDPASDTWRKHPAAMIQKVAEVFVLRRQFGITAIVAREEISRDLADESVVASFKVAPEPELPAAVPAPGAAPELTIVPSATDFWRAVRAAAARVGSSAIEFVRTRAGGETDLRKLAPDVAMRIYSEAMQFIEADPTGTTVAHPRGGAGEAASRKPRTARVQRDYTQFWATVRKAAEAEGDPSPQAWLARLANGVTDLRDLDDATFIGLLAVSTRVANGQAATKEPPAAELATPAVARIGDDGVLSRGDETEPIRRDQIREIQRFWRERTVHPNTQCEQVRQVTGSHMILARMTEVQADQLLAQLQQQAAETAQAIQSSNEDRAAEDR